MPGAQFNRTAAAALESRKQCDAATSLSADERRAMVLCIFFHQVFALNKVSRSLGNRIQPL